MYRTTKDEEYNNQNEQYTRLQGSSTLTPGTGFVEDNFSKDLGGGGGEWF